MAAFFASASSQKIINSAPAISAAPFTVGIWVRPTTTGVTKSFWSLSDTAGAINYFTLQQRSTDNWGLEQTDDASPIAASAGTVTANRWAFVVGRFIASNSRRLAVLTYDGAISHANNTITDAPVGLDVMALGCLNHSSPTSFFDGSIAEFWYTSADVQPGGGQLQDALLRQLACGGPFSLPHIAKDIVEYRGFRQVLTSDHDKPDEVYWGAGKTRQTWTNTNGVTLGPHVPLPGYYETPIDFRRIGIV